MTLLFNTFAVHDFGGQPEYYPWHKLFLSREALYLLVADLSEGVDECCAALEEQLSILSASVPGAVVVVILTKTDKVGGGGGAATTSSSSLEVREQRLMSSIEVEQRSMEVEQRLMEWSANRLRRRNKVGEGGFKDAPPRIQFPVLCTSSVTQVGIAELRYRMVGTAKEAGSKECEKEEAAREGEEGKGGKDKEGTAKARAREGTGKAAS